MKLEGKYIWITGSSGGIGLAMAEQAVSEGAACVVLSGSNPSKLEKAKASCEARGKAQILTSLFDITVDQQRRQAVADVLAQLPRIDILVNNAGVSQRAALLDTSVEVERYLMEVNFWSAAELTRLLLPQMLANGAGYIGLTSSVTGLFGVPLRSSYCASKHAANGYFLALLSEYYSRGIRVTILCPGKVNTEISKRALLGDGSALGIIERGHKNGLAPKHCASLFWRGLKHSKVMVYAARSELIAIYLHRLSMQWGVALIRKVLPLKESRDDARW